MNFDGSLSEFGCTSDHGSCLYTFLSIWRDFQGLYQGLYPSFHGPQAPQAPVHRQLRLSLSCASAGRHGQTVESAMPGCCDMGTVAAPVARWLTTLELNKCCILDAAGLQQLVRLANSSITHLHDKCSTSIGQHDTNVMDWKLHDKSNVCDKEKHQPTETFVS